MLPPGFARPLPAPTLPPDVPDPPPLPLPLPLPRPAPGPSAPEPLFALGPVSFFPAESAEAAAAAAAAAEGDDAAFPPRLVTLPEGPLPSPPRVPDDTLPDAVDDFCGETLLDVGDFCLPLPLPLLALLPLLPVLLPLRLAAAAVLGGALLPAFPYSELRGTERGVSFCDPLLGVVAPLPVGAAAVAVVVAAVEEAVVAAVVVAAAAAGVAADGDAGEEGVPSGVLVGPPRSTPRSVDAPSPPFIPLYPGRRQTKTVCLFLEHQGDRGGEEGGARGYNPGRSEGRGMRCKELQSRE